MSALAMHRALPFAFIAPSAGWWRSFLAAGVAVGLHALVLVLLLTHWQADTPPAPQVRTLTTRLVTLAPPAPPAPSQPEVSVAPPALVEPVRPVRPLEAPRPDPNLEQRKLEQAALARKRVEQQRERQRLEREQAERQRIERERREADQRARQRAQEAQARAAAAAAERARQAESAAAASRQYLPIAKQAPDYPDRAQEKGIEGDCTVSYRVNPQGRVEKPQVVGDCHPLFIRPSLSAAKSFRYQPRIEGGQAVAVDGVKNTFHYRLE